MARNLPYHFLTNQFLVLPGAPGNNFSIVFSEGEEGGEEEEEEGGRDELLSSQINRQIQKVTSFLKMDRLRRTKVPKNH